MTYPDPLGPSLRIIAGKAEPLKPLKGELRIVPPADRPPVEDWVSVPRFCDRCHQVISERVAVWVHRETREVWCEPCIRKDEST